MVKAGLSFADPLLEKLNIGEQPNPYAPFSPTSNIGAGNLGPSAADIAVVGETLAKQNQFTLPQMKQPPSIAYSPSRKELFVQGITFPADDAPAALEAEKYLFDQNTGELAAGTGLPAGGDWIPLDVSAYQQFTESIRNPSLSRLARKNFGIGVDQLQLLGGRALQLAGFENLGGKIVEQQKEDLRRAAPYERAFTDIESGDDAIEWFVANFAQQGPNLIESVLTAGLGFLAGSAIGGPLGAVGGTLAGLLRKKAFKEAVTAAAKKKLAGEVLNNAEKKILREAAGLAGATAATYGQNLAIGAADIYDALREQGADPEDTDARLKALLGSIPYAALESLPEFLFAARIFGAFGPTRKTGLIRRAVTGATTGGLAEGTTEFGQDVLTLGLSGQDLSSPESINQLVNAFAAGFGIGAPLGAGANLRSRKPQNLLNPGETPEPNTGIKTIESTAPSGLSSVPAVPSNFPVPTSESVYGSTEFSGPFGPPSLPGYSPAISAQPVETLEFSKPNVGLNIPETPQGNLPVIDTRPRQFIQAGNTILATPETANLPVVYTEPTESVPSRYTIPLESPIPTVYTEPTESVPSRYTIPLGDSIPAVYTEPTESIPVYTKLTESVPVYTEPTESIKPKLISIENAPIIKPKIKLLKKGLKTKITPTEQVQLQEQITPTEQVQLQEQITPTEQIRPQKPVKEVAKAIGYSKLARKPSVFKKYAEPIIHHAFFGSDKKATDKAKAFLNTYNFTDEQKVLMDDIFVAMVNAQPELKAIYNKKEYAPWFSYAVSHGLLDKINTKITNLPKKFKQNKQKTSAGKIISKQNKKKQTKKKQDKIKWDDNNGVFYRDDGTIIKEKIPTGRVRLITSGFLNKLRVKPNVSVYKNIEDLKKRNPDLYQRAAAARKENDFDTTKAAGYSFGKDVIIFTDFIYTEQQLKFILAHEIIGHFGLRAVIPGKNLEKILNQIYDNDPNVQATVDAVIANHDISKLEAIEEYLADNAATLDTSIVARLWNVIKNFLNKLGFKFQDDEARYFINLARRFVRSGDGHFVSFDNILADFLALDQDAIEGRYERVIAGDLGSRVFTAGALNRGHMGSGGLRGAVEAFSKKVFGARHDVPGTVSRLLEEVQTLNNKARRSYGLNHIYRLLEKQHRFARSLLSKYQRLTAYTHSADLGLFKKGVTEKQKETAGELLARAALLKAKEATDELIKSFGPLAKVDDFGNVIIDQEVREAIEKVGFVTAEEFRKGFEIEYSDGSKVTFQYDVDEESPEWKIYLENRKAINEAAIDLLLANYEAAQAEATRVINELNIGRPDTHVFAAEDLFTIKKLAKIYQDIRYEGSDESEAGIKAQRKAARKAEDFAFLVKQVLHIDDANLDAEFRKNHDDVYDDVVKLREKIRNEKEAIKIQKAIRDLFLFDLQSKNADYYAKRTILGSYVPFTRRGTEQVRLIAVDKKGKQILLDESIRSTLPYFQFNTRSEALETAQELDKVFGKDEYILIDDNGDEVSVRLRAEISRVRQSPELAESVNFNEFVYVLNRLNVDIPAHAYEQIVLTLTEQNAKVRHSLHRSGTEGWDKNVIRSASEYLETTAHIAAKKMFRYRLDDIMLNKSYWLGDDDLLKNLEENIKNAQTAADRFRAQRAYDEYAYMYRYMKATAGENYVYINGKKVPTLGRGEDYREEAKKILRWYNDTTNITDSTEDLLSGETGSSLKLITVLMQLGGSIATAALNMTSLATNTIPYLSYYNSANGFGGGYGEAKTTAALWQAIRDLKNPKLADAGYLEKIIKTKEYKQYGLTEDEAKFLFTQTEQGALQAAQFNALIGTARGKVFNNKAQAAIKAWMMPFTYTEQFNRRVTALATYRLEKERLYALGEDDEKQIIFDATEAARKAVNYTQGEYAIYNRPTMARGNILQYVFMYKQFPIITVQLLKALPRRGQLLMLGFLMLSSGLKGLPFAEDMMDIIDTIAQMLGLKMASIEKEITQWLNDIAPGMTPYVMRGVIDRMTSATVSTRLGMGDLIPLTGIFKAGADPAREAANFAGPVFSGISGLVGMAGNIAKYGAEAIGVREGATSFTDILRKSPITAIRAISDGLVYLDTGAIINTKGQVISKDVPYYTIITRMLGFYPAIATEQNDVIRLSKQVADYNKAIKAEYVSAYVKAKLKHDTKRMQKIISDVQAWNAATRGTGLEISRFSHSANQAYRKAKQPAIKRYLKSTLKNVRPETRELLEIYGIAEE